jgi:putative NADH-flavin reductase
MIITVFGANGRTGRHVVEEALEAGHEVQAVVRDPGTLGIRHPRLTIAQGNVLDAGTIEVRGEVVVSAIGARSRNAGTIASQGTANILDAMRRAGVKRVVSISAAPLGDPQVGGGWFDRFLFRTLWKFFRDLYEDLSRMETALRKGGVAWTVMRPPRLTNGPRTKRYRTAIDHNVGRAISRADLASEMLRVLGDERTVGHTVGIGY